MRNRYYILYMNMNSNIFMCNVYVKMRGNGVCVPNMAHI